MNKSNIIIDYTPSHVISYFVAPIIYFILVIAFIFLVKGVGQFAMAYSDKKKSKRGKRNMLIGGVLLIFSYIVIIVLVNLLGPLFVFPGLYP